CGVVGGWWGAGGRGLGAFPTRRSSDLTAPAAAVPPMVVHDHVRTPVGRRIDRVSLFALAACRLAAQDAGLALAGLPPARTGLVRSEEHTSELQSLAYLVCRLLLEKKKK